MDVLSDEHMGGHLHHGLFDVFSLQTFLDSFIPGYGAANKFITNTLDYDATALICLCAALWLLARVCRLIWATIDSVLERYYTSEISVNSEDEIFDHLISLFARQQDTHHRRLKAETPWRSTWETSSDQARSLELINGGEESILWLNFSKEGAISQPQPIPDTGLYKVWHKGIYFELRREEKTLFDKAGDGGFTLGDAQRLTLSCWGRSPDPIKKLIQYAKEQHYLRYSAETTIKRPAQKHMRRFDHSCWATVAQRLYRPIENIVFDKDLKTQVLRNINEYLSPATARWYARRGIPYRRGYLFHGPPGTGKTSLTFALAGDFRLNIYIISLLDSSLTEEDLATLFNNFPARSISSLTFLRYYDAFYDSCMGRRGSSGWYIKSNFWPVNR